MVKRFNRLEEAFLVYSLFALVLLIFAQVVGRYIFQSSPSWTEEAARYLHIAQVWIGAAYAVKLREHIRIEAFLDLFHGAFRKILETLSVTIWFMLALFLAIYGSKMVVFSMDKNQVTPALGLPFWIPYLAIPLGTILMSFRLIFQVVEIWKGKVATEKEETHL